MEQSNFKLDLNSHPITARYDVAMPKPFLLFVSFYSSVTIHVFNLSHLHGFVAFCHTSHHFYASNIYFNDKVGQDKLAL